MTVPLKSNPSTIIMFLEGGKNVHLSFVLFLQTTQMTLALKIVFYFYVVHEQDTHTHTHSQ